MEAQTPSVKRPAAEADRPLPLPQAAFWIGWFSCRELARRRRLLAVGAVALMPVLLAVAWRLLDRQGSVPAPLLLANLGGVVYVPFLTALVSLVLGVSAVGEEVEEGTILYYWTRPIGRGAIFMGRLAAAQTVASALLVGSLALCCAVILTRDPSLLAGPFLKLYLATVAAVTAGAWVYTAVFTTMGVLLRRPLLVCLLFAFGWETMTGNIPARIQQLTIVYHLRNLMRGAEAAAGGAPGWLQELQRQLFRQEPLPEWRSALALAGVLAAAAALGILVLRRKEIFR